MRIAPSLVVHPISTGQVGISRMAQGHVWTLRLCVRFISAHMSARSSGGLLNITPSGFLRRYTSRSLPMVVSSGLEVELAICAEVGALVMARSNEHS